MLTLHARDRFLCSQSPARVHVLFSRVNEGFVCSGDVTQEAGGVFCGRAVVLHRVVLHCGTVSTGLFLVSVAEQKVTVAERKVSATPFGLVVLHQGRSNLTGTVVYPAFPQDLCHSSARPR